MNPSAQDQIYSSSDYHQHKHGVSSKALDLIIRYRTQKFSALTRSKTLDICEVGVGPGWNIVQLPAHRRVGLDVTDAYAEYLRSVGVEFVSEISQLAGQQFDLVILSHVMEHLLEPAKMLEECGRILEPDGELLIIVPLEPAKRRISSRDTDHHLFSWNVNTFIGFVTACGYSVRIWKVSRYGFDRFAAELAVRLGFGFGLYRFLLFLLRAIRPGYEIQVLANRRGNNGKIG